MDIKIEAEKTSAFASVNLYFTIKEDIEPIACDYDYKIGEMFVPDQVLVAYRRENDGPWTHKPVRLFRLDHSHTVAESSPFYEWAQQLITDHHPEGVQLRQQFSGPGHDLYIAEVNAWLAANGLLDARAYVAEPGPRVIGDKIVIWRADADPETFNRRTAANIREEHPLLVPLPPSLRAE